MTFDLPANGEWELTFESIGSRLLDERVTIPAVPVPDLNLNSPTSLEDLQTLPSYVPVVNGPDPALYGADAYYPVLPVRLARQFSKATSASSPSASFLSNTTRSPGSSCTIPICE